MTSNIASYFPEPEVNVNKNQQIDLWLLIHKLYRIPDGDLLLYFTHIASKPPSL